MSFGHKLFKDSFCYYTLEIVRSSQKICIISLSSEKYEVHFVFISSSFRKQIATRFWRSSENVSESSARDEGLNRSVRLERRGMASISVSHKQVLAVVRMRRHLHSVTVQCACVLCASGSVLNMERILNLELRKKNNGKSN